MFPVKLTQVEKLKQKLNLMVHNRRFSFSLNAQFEKVNCGLIFTVTRDWSVTFCEDTHFMDQEWITLSQSFHEKRWKVYSNFMVDSVDGTEPKL